MSDQSTHSAPSVPSGSQTVRLVVSWLIVGVPLVYALAMTVTSVLPLFAG